MGAHSPMEILRKCIIIGRAAVAPCVLDFNSHSAGSPESESPALVASVTPHLLDLLVV